MPRQYLLRGIKIVFQIVDMKPSELKMVADHMGHNENIHTDIYKLQSSILEKSKVASLLIAMENGTLPARFKGRKLEEIEETGMSAVLSNLAYLSFNQNLFDRKFKTQKLEVGSL